MIKTCLSKTLGQYVTGFAFHPGFETIRSATKGRADAGIRDTSEVNTQCRPVLIIDFPNLNFRTDKVRT